MRAAKIELGRARARVSLDRTAPEIDLVGGVGDEARQRP
jgi:hypothetical protein